MIQHSLEIFNHRPLLPLWLFSRLFRLSKGLYQGCEEAQVKGLYFWVPLPYSYSCGILRGENKMSNPLGSDPDIQPDPSSYDPLSDPAFSSAFQQTDYSGLSGPPGNGTLDNNLNPYPPGSSLVSPADPSIGSTQGSLITGGSDSGSNTDGVLFALNPANWGLIFDNISAANTGQFAGQTLGDAAGGFVSGLESSIENTSGFSLGGNKLAYLMLASFALSIGGLVYLIYRK
jgi:hypothetical protein